MTIPGKEERMPEKSIIIIGSGIAGRRLHD